ncbi:hypothetical protein [Paenibacillus lemnae]|uniref:Uncharacterized protein n=1 Tax=Paenibacillus lemnae TaxID=1330551 RepID=A0A848M8M7_PAELE|nr:hypothetical protein [Paenibacillus lemnae]NMO96619.1 hypothetical protein [Paenibacillus lemnae]
MFRRILFMLGLLFIIAVLGGCEAKDNAESLHKMKMLVVAFGPTEEEFHEVIEQDMVKGLNRDVFFMAERYLKYFFKPTGDILNGSESVAYNLSYLFNLPVKLYKNISYDFTLTEDELKGSMMTQAMKWMLVVYDVITALVGLLLALVMLPIGALIGLVAHPIATFLDLIPSLWGLIQSIYAAVAHFFTWESRT